MKIYFDHLYCKYLFLSIFALFLFSCTSSPDKQVSKQQWGDELNTIINGKSKGNSISNKEAILSFYNKNSLTNLVDYTEETVVLYDKYVTINEPISKISFKGLSEEKNPSGIVFTLLSLYPIDSYSLVKKLYLESGMQKENVRTSAIEAGLDPTVLFSPPSSGASYRVTPLIESVGLVLFDQNEDNTHDVYFRETGNSNWKSALELQWDPIYSSAAGSIIDLKPATAYEVKISSMAVDGTIEITNLNFETNPNSPPIDPEKIYYLSDIYTGGILDLEKLGIEGTEKGWAKIIGNGTTIDATNEGRYAVNIGSQSYIMLEDFNVKGGNRYAIFSDKAHHIWIKGCEVSEFGRMPNDYRNGLGYFDEDSSSPYNYDSGIYLQKTGVVVIENCSIHSPVGKANSWIYGHPSGPNAIMVYANHPEERYRGQTIIRNNKLFGSANHRFNDVIEGRSNFNRQGGFVRDSAVYGNYIAYANDDLLEIDGGQQNVLVYRNEFTQGYTGISIAPNMLGPSYIFQNYIHDLGDETGKEWTAIKAGGLISKPGGLTLIMENLIRTSRNGIAASNVESDDTFWIIAQNNFIELTYFTNLVGLGIQDRQKYHKSKFINNITYNRQLKAPNNNVSLEHYEPHHLTSDEDYISSQSSVSTVSLPIGDKYLINNFSRILNTVESSPTGRSLNLSNLRNFSNQTKYGNAQLVAPNSVYLEGNIWKRTAINYTVTPDTVLKANISINGPAEIIGIGFENDNDITESRIINLYGTQNYGIDKRDIMEKNNSQEVILDIGKLISGEITRIVFVLDNDNASKNQYSSVTFSEIYLFEKMNENSTSYEIEVGL
jgi:hypothetical protein